MQLLLTIISGTRKGHKIVLRDGQTIQVGRTEWSEFSVPDDQQMSGIHFSITCSAATCQIRDLNSTNGTFVNGKKLTSASLTDGDEIQAGSTTFAVHIEGLVPQSTDVQQPADPASVDINRITQTAFDVPTDAAPVVAPSPA